MAPWLRIALIALIVGATFYAEARILGSVLWGGALYVPIVAALTAIGAVLLRQQPVAGGGMGNWCFVLGFVVGLWS
jgi:hypothetical protein